MRINPPAKATQSPRRGAQIFLCQFQSRWDEATAYDQYLKEVLSEIRNHNPAVSTELLSSQLQIQESEIKRILSLDRSQRPDQQENGL